MSTVIWMSDTHVIRDGLVAGHDPRERLRSAIRYVNDHHGDAAFCVVSGDMVDEATVANYAALAELLDTLNVPVLPMMGNHDDRGLLRQAFPVPDDCMADFVQYTASVDGATLVCLDTNKLGSSDGEICHQREAWLRTRLAERPDSPTYVFMHHPPLPLGLPMQDTERLANGERLLDLVRQHDCVQHVFVGHVHRHVVATHRGLSVASIGSVLYQAPPPHPAWDWDTFEPSDDPSQIGVLTIDETGVILRPVDLVD